MNSAPIAYLVLRTDLGPYNPAGYVASAASFPKVGHCFQLFPGKNVIGRQAAPDVSIVVPAIVISRRHAQIDWPATACWEIEDLQSRNGTILNGQRLNPRTNTLLNEGDQIELGRVQLLPTCQTDPKDPRTQMNPTAEQLETWLRGPYMNGDH